MKLERAEKQKLSNFSMQIQTETLKAFDQVCKKLRIKRSDGIRQLIGQFLVDHENKLKSEAIPNDLKNT